ncbi:MAG: helix-turn-helix transcriptional regulator [Planctomycetes bacterium]|nr:helix-turn-helix transcriptional regulator [Planctomycetota bacterium]
MPIRESASIRLARCGLEFVAGWRQSLGPTCSLHGHAGFELVLHPKGGGRTATATGAIQHFRPGSAVLYAPGIAHEQWGHGRGEEWCIQALPRRPLRDLPDLIHLGDCADPYVWSEAALLTRVPPDERDARQLELGMRVTALLLRVLVLGSDAEQRLPTLSRRRTEAARAWLRDRFREPRCLDEVANAVGVSVDHLRHCFKRELGIGMARYVAGLRIAHAKELLAQTSLPLRAIAPLCGYANERYLSRVFRALEGAPPGRFRPRSPQ